MMKKMLTLLAVAAIPTVMSGCAACCPSLSLCPCCPCNWFNRGAPCPPTYAAPLVSSPCAPAPYAQTVIPQVMPQQFVMPQQYAAPLAASAPCATWNPCQGAVMNQPQAYSPQQPAYAQPAYYAEPNCGYAEASCGAPMNVSYGPEIIVGCDPCGGGGCCDGGAAPMVAPPAPEQFVDPRPVAE